MEPTVPVCPRCQGTESQDRNDILLFGSKFECKKCMTCGVTIFTDGSATRSTVRIGLLYYYEEIEDELQMHLDNYLESKEVVNIPHGNTAKLSARFQQN